MNLWLFKQYSRSLRHIKQKRNDGQNLRDTEADIGEQHITRALACDALRLPAVRSRCDFLYREAMDQPKLPQPMRNHSLKRQAGRFRPKVHSLVIFFSGENCIDGLLATLPDICRPGTRPEIVPFWVFAQGSKVKNGIDCLRRQL